MTLKDQCLTIPQMMRLQEMGIDTSNSSVLMIINNDTATYVDNTTNVEDGTRVLTIADMIQLLPESISTDPSAIISIENNDNSVVRIDFQEYFIKITNSSVEYERYGKIFICMDTPELKESLYEMIIFLQTNNLLIKNN